MKVRRTVVLALFASLVLVGLAEAQRKPKNKRNEGIPLVFKPTTEYGDLDPINLTGISKVKVEIEPFTDSRTEGELIGRNIEDASPLPKTFRSSLRSDSSRSWGDWGSGQLRAAAML